MDGCSSNQEPLQIILQIEDIVKLIEKMTADLSSGCYVSIKPSILSLSFNLKRQGPSLERLHSEHLKRLQQVMRSACRDTKLDLVSRVHILEIIEMRSLNWAASHHVTNFYKMKLDQIKELSAPAAAQTNCSKPASLLNANAPDFCLSMSIPNHPTKSVSFNPDCSPFVSLHQPPVNQNPLVSNSGDNLVSNPGNVPTSRNQSGEERMNSSTADISSEEEVTIPKYCGSLDNITVQDANSIKDAITVHGDSINKDTFTVQDDISNITIQEDYSNKEAFALQGDNGGKNTPAVKGDIIIKETSTVQSDSDIKTTVTVNTKDGEITLTCISMDLLHIAQKILEEGLKDKIVVKNGPSPTTSHNVASPGLKDKIVVKNGPSPTTSHNVASPGYVTSD